jgi:hypothetical protein
MDPAIRFLLSKHNVVTHAITAASIWAASQSNTNVEMIVFAVGDQRATDSRITHGVLGTAHKVVFLGPKQKSKVIQ